VLPSFAEGSTYLDYHGRGCPQRATSNFPLRFGICVKLFVKFDIPPVSELETTYQLRVGLVGSTATTANRHRAPSLQG
jgi:hypothetical protein